MTDYFVHSLSDTYFAYALDLRLPRPVLDGSDGYVTVPADNGTLLRLSYADFRLCDPAFGCTGKNCARQEQVEQARAQINATCAEQNDR